MRKVLNVPDISCEHCERAITEALQPMAGVASIAVDIPGHRVTVEYDESRVTVARIKAAVEGADYPVASIE